jgi:hypothetical protein
LSLVVRRKRSRAIVREKSEYQYGQTRN